MRRQYEAKWLSNPMSCSDIILKENPSKYASSTAGKIEPNKGAITKQAKHIMVGGPNHSHSRRPQHKTLVSNQGAINTRESSKMRSVSIIQACAQSATMMTNNIQNSTRAGDIQNDATASDDQNEVQPSNNQDQDGQDECRHPAEGGISDAKTHQKAGDMTSTRLIELMWQHKLFSEVKYLYNMNAILVRWHIDLWYTIQDSPNSCALIKMWKRGMDRLTCSDFYIKDSSSESQLSFVL